MAKRDIKTETTSVRDLPTPPGCPDSVRILGQTYRILYRTPLIWPGGTVLHGMVSSRDRTILVDPTAPAHLVRETILHEIAHVYIDHSGFEGKLAKAKLVEMVCDLFGSAVDDLMQNNPRLLG